MPYPFYSQIYHDESTDKSGTTDIRRMAQSIVRDVRDQMYASHSTNLQNHFLSSSSTSNTSSPKREIEGVDSTFVNKVIALLNEVFPHIYCVIKKRVRHDIRTVHVSVKAHDEPRTDIVFEIGPKKTTAYVQGSPAIPNDCRGVSITKYMRGSLTTLSNDCWTDFVGWISVTKNAIKSTSGI